MLGVDRRLGPRGGVAITADEQTLEAAIAIFSQHVWNRQLICDEMIRLESDGNRTGHRSLPAAESNTSVAQNGHLVLEDLFISFRNPIWNA